MASNLSYKCRHENILKNLSQKSRINVLDLIIIILVIIIIITIYIYIAQTSIWIYSVALHNIVKVKLC